MTPEELQHFFDQSQDVVGIINREMCYDMVNLAYCEYWGLDRETVLNSTVQEVIGKTEYTQTIHASLKTCLAGEHIAFERWIDFPGVGKRHMNVQYNPRRDENGEVSSVLLISRDTTPNKLLEAKISKERDRYDTILSSTNVGLMLFNPDLTIEWYNRQILDMFPEGNVEDTKCHIFFKKCDKPCDNCIALETFRTGMHQAMDTYYPDKDRWFAFSTEPILDSEGNVKQALGHIRDITERKRAEEALQSRETELRSIFKATRVGMGIVRDRQFIQANDYLFTMLGYDKEELLGHGTRKVYATLEEYRYTGEKVYKLIQGETSNAVEVRWMRKDGTLLDVLITVSAINPDNPGAEAAFAVMDITDRKKAEQAILESEHRFRDLFENVDMIAVQGYDKDRRVVYWNPASEKLYGYSLEEAVGSLLEELIIPDPMKEDVREATAAWMNGGPAIPAGELTLSHKDGTPIPVYSSHVMQETSTGEKYMYCIDIDLSEIRRIHNQLLKAKNEAEAANRSKSEFLANMSHEIRTPLNGIQGMLTLLKGTGLNELQMDYAQAGVDSASRLNGLLSDILDLSQVEAGKLVLCAEPFDLPDVIAQVEDLFRLTTKESKVSLHCDVEDVVPQYVSGDGTRLRQVLTNLVGNALKYTDAGEVRVEVASLSPIKPDQSRILFSVSDTGIGIDKDMLKTLFAPFIQGSQGYTRQYQGAGLGLSICKRLVNLMGGNMAVDSRPDHGTTVHVVIPFGKATELVQPLVIETPQRTGGGAGLNILLAEDDRINSIVGKRLLEKEGATVTIAVNGKEAVDTLKENHFDAILMDVQMPVLDGAKATTAIRNGAAGPQNQGIYICALTAFTMTGDREKFLEAGMNGYIPKPVDTEDIQRILADIVEHKETLSQ